MTKQSLVVLFLGIIIFASTFNIYHFADAQINSSETNNSNNNIQPITPTSALNDTQGEDEANWSIISGNWTILDDGLQGGTLDNTKSLPNNVILNPEIPDNFTEVSTSFQINNLNSSTPNYASIVHSFVDPENYQYAGINIHRGDVYAVVYTFNDANLTSEPQWPGIKTNLTWVPGTSYNVSLINQGTSLDLIINGTKYYSQSINGNESNPGYMGLNYGRIQDIVFKTFEIESMNQQQIPIGVPKITDQNSSITMDTQTILLEGMSFPEESYIHLYDTTPYEIASGHIAAKLPCNEDNSTEINVLVGQAPTLVPMSLEYVSALSMPEELCLYHADINSSGSTPATDIAIENNSTDNIDFPDTSSVVISVSEISKVE
jgi:hypothetical protein